MHKFPNFSNNNSTLTPSLAKIGQQREGGFMQEMKKEKRKLRIPILTPKYNVPHKCQHTMSAFLLDTLSCKRKFALQS